MTQGQSYVCSCDSDCETEIQHAIVHLLNVAVIAHRTGIADAELQEGAHVECKLCGDGTSTQSTVQCPLVPVFTPVTRNKIHPFGV